MTAAKKMKLWFRTYNEPYKGNEPAFYDPQDFDWARYVIGNWAVIREEMKVMIDEGHNEVLKPYFEDSIQWPPKNWKTESFYFWTKANRLMINMFPKTNEIIRQVPGLVSASINLLEPGTRINPHYGDTNAIYRCHLGLKIPAGLPECGFRVEQETRAWEEGNFLIFLDAYTHEGFNYSKDKRYILLLDVLRPEFRSRKYAISTYIMGAVSIYQITGKIPGMRERFERMSKPLKGFFLFFTRAYWWLHLTAQRTIFSTYLK